MLDDTPGFHQCVTYEHLAQHDLSNWFVDKISERFDCVAIAEDTVSDGWRKYRQIQVNAFLETTMLDNNIKDINKIKPGVAEATRVMLRRVPRLLVLRKANSSDVKHLIVLANEKNIPIEENPSMPFEAMAIIENIKE